MERDLQAVVDRLSRRLGRAVLIDDAELHPLAYSSQTGTVDAVRATSILERGAPPAVRDTLLGRGIADARAAVHIAAEPAIDMAARVCVPIGPPGDRHGYLWVIEDEPLPPADVAAAQEAAGRAATLMAAAAGPEAERRRRDQALLDDLVAGARPPAELARELERHRLLGGRPLTLCLTATAGGGGDAERRWLQAGLDRLREAMSAGFVLAGEVDGRPACLAVARDSALGELGAESVADALLAAIAEQPAPADARGVVAEGHVFGDLGEAPVAGERARVALRAAGAQGGAVRWDELGAERLLARLEPAEALAELPEGVARLLEPQHAVLRETLEAFLERAGDVKATAEALALHRAGLYYRLARIEELAGVDLHRGDDRLLCHLALRLARRAP